MARGYGLFPCALRYLGRGLGQVYAGKQLGLVRRRLLLPVLPMGLLQVLLQVRQLQVCQVQQEALTLCDGNQAKAEPQQGGPCG